MRKGKNMSHFTRIKTVVRELNPLEKALREVLGWETVRNGFIRGYSGNTQRAALVAVNPRRSYDIGYVKADGAETYELVTDFYGLKNEDLPCKQAELADRITQQYALNILREEGERLGFDFSQVVTNEEGAMTVSLSRW